jgi:kynurenine formamidase
MRFDPLFERDGLSVSRSPWGPDDQIGRLNWMTPASQAEVLARVDGSRMFDLAVDYFMGMPSWTAAKDPKYDIWMTHTPQGSVNDNHSGAGRTANEAYSYAGSAVTMYTHTGTHLCGLNHIGHFGRFWNGWTADTHLGSRAWTVGGSFPPIVARAVLLDVAGTKGVDCLPDSYVITIQDIREALARTATEFGAGDIALVRTGRMSRWPDQDRFLSSPPGLGMDSAKFLCEELGCMCIGVDAGGEALPPEKPDSFLPVHAYLFATAGAPLFENVWLEDLARERMCEFAFLAFPIKLLGSTGMPTRPVAIAFRQEQAPGALRVP